MDFHKFFEIYTHIFLLLVILHFLILHEIIFFNFKRIIEEQYEKYHISSLKGGRGMVRSKTRIGVDSLTGNDCAIIAKSYKLSAWEIQLIYIAIMFGIKFILSIPLAGIYLYLL